MHTTIPKTAATVQPIQSKTIAESQIASAASVTAQSTISHELLYVPTEAARIVYHLTDGYFDPGYILLFGKLVGGTPHNAARSDPRRRNDRSVWIVHQNIFDIFTLCF